MKKKGLVARSRRSYVEKGLETRITEGVTSALYFARDENPLAVGIEVGQPAPADAQNYLVPIRIRVPFSRITLLPEGPIARGRVILYFIVVDSEGKQSELANQVVPVEIDAKELGNLARRDFVYDVRLLMIPGGQRLSLAVRDEPTNTVSYVQQSVFVSVLPPEAAPGGEVTRRSSFRDGGRRVRVLGAAEAREADARTIAAGTPGIVLMERASEAVARECVRAIAAVAAPRRARRRPLRHGEQRRRRFRRGPAAAPEPRHRRGGGSPRRGPGEGLGRRRRDAPPARERGRGRRRGRRSRGPRAAPRCDARRRRPLRHGPLAARRGGSLHALAVRLASSRRAFVVAVDVPSGLDSGSGRADVPHVRADLTVTFGFPKLAHLLAPAAGSCGRVVVADIGLLPDAGGRRGPGGGHGPRRRAALPAATGRRAQGDVRDARRRRRRLGNGGCRGPRGPRRLPMRSGEGRRRRGGGEPRGDSRPRRGGHDGGRSRSRRADGPRRRAGARDLARLPRASRGCARRPRSRPFSTPTP